MTQNWITPPRSYGRGRSTAILPYATGLIFFSWTHPIAYVYIGGNWSTINLPATVVPDAHNQGYAFSCVGAANSVWACAYMGGLLQIDTTGVATSYSLPAGIDFVAGMTSDPSGNPWIVATNGSVWKWNGTTLVQVASNPGGVVGPAQRAVWQNSKFYTIFAGSNKVYELTTGATPAWTGDTIAGISDGPYALGLNGSDVAVAYGGDISLAFPATQIVPATVVGHFLMTDSTNNLLRIVGRDVNNFWVSLQTLSVTGATYLDVLPSNAYALVSSPANNTVSVMQNVSGTWSLSTTLSLTNPNGIAISPDGTYGVICQKSLNQVMPFSYSAGTFTLGTPFSGVLSPTVAAFNRDGTWLYVGNNGALTAVQYNAGNWIVKAAVPVTGATISDITAMDTQGDTIAVGYAGGVVTVDGKVLQGVSVYDPAHPPPASLGYFSAVAPSQICAFEDGFLIADNNASGYLDKLEPTAAGFTFTPILSGPFSAVGTGVYGGRLYILAASGSNLNFYGPSYASGLETRKYNYVSVLSSTTSAITGTLNLGESLKIAGLGYAGGFLWATDCLQNKVFKLSFGATPAISDQAVIQPPTPQLSNALSGLSQINLVGTTVYIASIFQGGLLAVS